MATDVTVTVVGAGLAGCECAFQLAERGVAVRLIEQKPKARTPAQTGDGLAELVCSNSFRGAALSNAVGLLKEEMRRAGSLVMQVGDGVRVPAGGAMAVDRERFSEEMTRRVHAHPNITVVSEEVTEIPAARPLVLATGPLTGDKLAADLARAIGAEHLAYYDSIAPIVAADSIDWSRVFRASRYDKGGDDAYVNCPFDRAEYEAFVAALLAAEKVAPRAFEEVRYFEGCLPVEVMAERGVRTLAFGPMKPVGLTDPRTGRWPYAVVQLRCEDAAQTAFNIVGFQTRMTQPEQRRVLGLIPGLQNARYERYGSVHRNTFVDAPRVLDDELALRALPDVHVAGQISGVEGYVESAACGLLVGIMLASKLLGEALPTPPATTALGSLLSHLRKPNPRFQPSNVVFSMFPEMVTGRMGKRERHTALAKRALTDLDPWLVSIGRPRDPSLPLMAAEDDAASAEPKAESDEMRKLSAAPA
ncbi:MAG TPA: methylenetetrahydrofolate--tRNA-(uracil(54)-C(5))-methyltransferase (FADH(2)-oxidizing) TrmFO [Polyangiales bacterium]|nr:methylenetetrahydrofolate--tRNA-(uracil(54)-C(5))-methyltransferase (FADH(2)-oxidizing) TrmFO [Polyangiales bacterium]